MKRASREAADARDTAIGRDHRGQVRPISRALGQQADANQKLVIPMPRPSPRWPSNRQCPSWR